MANNIKAFRTRMGLSQEALAEYLGVNREEISYFENAKRKVPTQILSKMANLFGIDEYDFYEEESPEKAAKLAFAFRADSLTSSDLMSIASFKKVVLNYLKMSKALQEDE